MPNYDFVKDLPIAKATEIETAGVLKKLYDAEILEYNNTNAYDISTKINGSLITFEVKEDFLCEFTGNVGLEYECRGKPSGINTSQADYYIYKLHTNHGIEFVMFRTGTLKQMIAEHKYFRVVNGGDKGSNSMNYLFKYGVFVRAGRILPIS
jgi:hypothetical protein